MGRCGSAQERRELTHGDNFLTTTTILPMQVDEPGGKWMLRISVGDQLLALHEFVVNADQGSQYRPYMGADGEISELARLALAEQSAIRVSLDELLSDQPDHETFTTDSIRVSGRRGRLQL